VGVPSPLPVVNQTVTRLITNVGCSNVYIRSEAVSLFMAVYLIFVLQ